MSTPVLLDTGAWISLLSLDDLRHRQVLQLLEKFKRANLALVTTSAVLLEVLDGLAKPSSSLSERVLSSSGQ